MRFQARHARRRGPPLCAQRSAAVLLVGAGRILWRHRQPLFFARRRLTAAHGAARTPRCGDHTAGASISSRGRHRRARPDPHRHRDWSDDHRMEARTRAGRGQGRSVPNTQMAVAVLPQVADLVEPRAPSWRRDPRARHRLRTALEQAHNGEFFYRCYFGDGSRATTDHQPGSQITRSATPSTPGCPAPS
jgi:hypothetical protein